MNITTPESVGFSTDRLQRIGAAMQRYIDRDQIAGIITLGARHGEVFHCLSQGMADRDSNRAMNLDAIFRIYSMSKPITSTAVMMLFEEGLLRLTDPLYAFLPAFKDMRVYQPRGIADYDLVPAVRPITIRDLLTHTAGLSYGFDQASFIDECYRRQIWGRLEKDPGMDTAQVIQEIAKLPLAHQPGTAYRYSMATDVLGHVVEVVSGKPLDVFMHEHIFDPLRMQDTDFYVPEAKAPRLTSVYGPDEHGNMKCIDAAATSNFLRKPGLLSGGGGLTSTTGDYLRFAQMLLNRGVLDGERLLGRKTVDFMLENHLPTGVVRADEPFTGFGLGGAMIRDVAGSQMMGSVGDWGWGGAANTWFWIDSQEQVIGLIMMQYQPAFVLPVTQDFKNTLYQALVD